MLIRHYIDVVMLWIVRRLGCVWHKEAVFYQTRSYILEEQLLNTRAFLIRKHDLRWLENKDVVQIVGDIGAALDWEMTELKTK